MPVECKWEMASNLGRCCQPGGFDEFEFEFGDGFDGVTGDDDFGVVGGEFVGGVFGAGEGAVGFVVEAGGDGFDGGVEEGVVLGVLGGEGEARFDGG